MLALERIANEAKPLQIVSLKLQITYDITYYMVSCNFYEIN